MPALILIVVCAVGISCLCSLTEAALYSVSWSGIERLRREGRKAGELLHEMRSRVDKPSAALVTLNTLVNTAGSAVAGVAAAGVMGAEYMPAFVAFFTFLILMIGEIIPKTLGVVHAETLAAFLARPLNALTRLSAPFICFIGLINRLILPRNRERSGITEADILAMASLSRKEGRIRPGEERIIGNILELDRKRVRDIMTPRTVVFSLPASMSLEEACANPRLWHFSRIPVHEGDNENPVGIVTRRALARHMADKDTRHTLGDLMQPIRFVSEIRPLHLLLEDFLGARTHLFAVLDEFGGLAGVVSLEDVLEEILGREIVDESDPVADLRELARRRRRDLMNG
jgi:CBS domain containing-hemolysin-like protein